MDEIDQAMTERVEQLEQQVEDLQRFKAYASRFFRLVGALFDEAAAGPVADREAITPVLPTPADSLTTS